MTSRPDQILAPTDERPEPVEASEPVEAPSEPVLRLDEARRRSIRPWAIAGGCVVSLAVIAAGLSSTALFEAADLAVLGERHLSERQVLKLAGVSSETNVLRLDESSVRRRLLGEPWILDATVSTRLPSTLRISIEERVAVAVAVTEGGRVLVAADGAALGKATPSTALPEVRLLAEPGAPAPAFDAVAAAATAAGSMAPTLRTQVRSLVVELDGTLTLELDEGIIVTYGTAEGADVKGEAIRAVLDYAAHEGRGLLSIDVSAPAAPTARFVGSPEIEDVAPENVGR